MDLVKIKNVGTRPFTLRHAIHGDTTIEPGAEQIVHTSVATVAFGDPIVRNEGNHKHRNNEFDRLRVMWGFYGGIHSEDDWPQMAPQFEAYTLDDKRVYFILDDPDGSLARGDDAAAQLGTPSRTLEARIAELEAEQAALMRALAAQNVVSTPNAPVAPTESATPDEDAPKKRASRRKAADDKPVDRDAIPEAGDDVPDVISDAPRTARTGTGKD